MFQHEMQEAKTNQVVITDIEPDTFKKVFYSTSFSPYQMHHQILDGSRHSQRVVGRFKFRQIEHYPDNISK